MRILVTGASGRLGRVLLARLREAGEEIFAIDRAPMTHEEGARSWVVDMRDYGQVVSAMARARAEAVIHLAAIPSPLGFPPEVVYSNNVVSDFNVFEAAATLGVRRVVGASSFSALGFPFQHRPMQPKYVPIDEEHPLEPQDAYGLAKANGEEIAAAYCRRGAGSAASIRIPTLINTEQESPWLARVQADPLHGIREMWAYIDMRDAAEVFYLAATTVYEGHLICYTAAPDTTVGLPTDALLDRYFPDVERRPGERAARWSLVNSARAEQALGFSPRYRLQVK